MNKSSPLYLKKIEELYKSGGYTLRYERGHFQPGRCVLRDKQIVVLNKFFTTEAKISALSDLATEIEWDSDTLELTQLNLLIEISQTRLKL
ncbi:MAG: hypothetical protein FJ344_07335 [Sphingomonadales bacterium]|nr:hypothetical protein [Sphingomonadales bacterium]